MKQVKLFLAGYFSFAAVFVLLRMVFMVVNSRFFTGCGLADVLAVAWHGLPLDLAVAGYVAVVPGLLLLVSLWTRRRWPWWVLEGWLFMVGWALVLIFVLNMVLYPYWRFPLDATPLFYFLTSPGATLASAGPAEMALGVALVVLFVVSLVLLVRHESRVLPPSVVPGHDKGMPSVRRPLKSTLVLAVLLALLFVPIRGGFTVSTMNTGKVYFSGRQELNHAAVNPAFSLLESLAHQEDFGSQYRYMDDSLAQRIAGTMTDTRSDSTLSVLHTRRPDVYLIVMESFSRLVMQTQATPCLNRLAHEGVAFTRFYANSFRTDRGLVAILAGYPIPPSVSLMKYPAKSRHLPSIARALTRVGYDAEYYYGGDADFCNQRSFLVSQGYRRIVEDKDFPVKYRLGKWGVPDGPLVEKAIRDIAADRSGRPMFRVIQTSSSHEPFDVPEQILPDKRLNAFAYADRSIGRFVSWLKKSGRWDRSVVLLVADHQGAWPESVSPLSLQRFEIPFVITGGAVRRPMEVATYGSQQDIAATLLGQLGIDHDEFRFSKDLLDATVAHFAFFTIPDAFGLCDGGNQLIYDNKSKSAAVNIGRKDANLRRGKAYLQCLMDDIGSK